MYLGETDGEELKGAVKELLARRRLGIATLEEQPGCVARGGSSSSSTVRNPSRASVCRSA